MTERKFVYSLNNFDKRIFLESIFYLFVSCGYPSGTVVCISTNDSSAIWTKKKGNSSSYIYERL